MAMPVPLIAIESKWVPVASEPGATAIVNGALEPAVIVPLVGVTVSNVCAGVAVKLVVTLQLSCTVCDGGAPWP